MTEAQEKLRAKLDLFPIGVPSSPETDKILTLLFPDEDARVACCVPNPPLMFTAREIARKAGVDGSEAKSRLGKMAERGLIMEVSAPGGKRYSLIPLVPGIMEMQFMLGQEITDERLEVGKLWHEAAHGEYGQEAFGYQTSGVRVIPINKTISSAQKIFRFDDVEKVIRDSGYTAITECACRKSAKKCDAPLDVCMIFGPFARYLADRGLARAVSCREAMKTLEIAEEAGLVHTATNSRAPVSIICNCCACCCSSLKGITVLNKPAESISSGFACEHTSFEKCKHCGLCAKACQFDAIKVTKEDFNIDTSKCIGCGVCVSKCKTGAISLVRVSQKKPPDTSVHLLARMLSERDKLPRIIKGIADDII